jgi:hypothetical protein
VQQTVTDYAKDFINIFNVLILLGKVLAFAFSLKGVGP